MGCGFWTSEEIKPAYTLISDFQPVELWENESQLLSHIGSGIVLW